MEYFQVLGGGESGGLDALKWVVGKLLWSAAHPFGYVGLEIDGLPLGAIRMAG